VGLWIDLESPVLSGWDEPILRNADRAGFQLDIIVVADISAKIRDRNILAPAEQFMSSRFLAGG
jgi:hypothetical protein